MHAAAYVQPRHDLVENDARALAHVALRECSEQSLLHVVQNALPILRRAIGGGGGDDDGRKQSASDGSP